MLRRIVTGIAVGVVALGAPEWCIAEGEKPVRTLHVVGRATNVVTATEIRLGDVAEIIATAATEDEAVIALQKIVLERSPAPGKDVGIPAAKILDRMKAAGVDIDAIGYTLPRVIEVKRASRSITEAEVLQAIEAATSAAGREISVKRVSLGGDIQVGPADTVVAAIPFGARGAGRLGFTITMRDEEGRASSFPVEAVIDEWAEMPVAKRALPRGAVVTEDDVMMARLNLSSLPGDVAREQSGIVGLSIASDIGFGEVFRRNKLAIPAVVQAKSRVTVMYRAPGFEATASGVALENGIVGQEIRVRNESSKKIISGIVVEPGLVRVKQ